MNLITSLSDRLKKISARSTIMLILASVITLAGCNAGTAGNNNQGGGDTQDEIELPNEKPNESEDEHTFSQLTLDMLNDEYYQNLIEEEKSHSSSNGNKLAPIPYGFLEGEGYDINPLLEGYEDNEQPTECNTFVYTSNTNQNELYINIRLYFNMTTPHYSYYTIKYTLSDEDMADFTYLNENNFYESALFIQNLSYEKEPEVTSYERIGLAAVTGTTRSLSNANFYDNSSPFLFYKGFDYDNQCLNFIVQPANINETVSKQKIYEITTYPPEGDKIEFRYDDVYFKPFNTTIESQEALDEYLNNYTSVTCYNLDGKKFLVDELNI